MVLEYSGIAMSLVIGITGGIGSGKSAATHRFGQHDIVVVDADVAARVIVEPGCPALNAIADHFGGDILLADGSLDRAALRQRVFADSGQRQWLEQLTHPLIGEEITARLSLSQSPYTVLSSPLLFETTQQDLCREAVLVDLSVELQIRRTMSRDDNSGEQVRRIIAAQMSREAKRALADHIIDNSGTVEQLHAQVDALHQQFLRQAKDAG